MRDGYGSRSRSRCHSSRYSSVSAGPSSLSPSSLHHLPFFSFYCTVFTTATTPLVCALLHRLGLRSRVLQPAKYSRHVQIIATFLAPFFPPAGMYPTRHWRLDRMSSTKHSRYARFPLLLSGALSTCSPGLDQCISDAFMRTCTASTDPPATLTGLDRYIGSITMYTVREHASLFVRCVYPIRAALVQLSLGRKSIMDVGLERRTGLNGRVSVARCKILKLDR